MSEFQREQRYIVIKTKDMDFAFSKGFLREDEVALFNDLIRKISLARDFRKSPLDTPPTHDELECVVVENNWHIYEPVWALVEMEWKLRCGQ